MVKTITHAGLCAIFFFGSLLSCAAADVIEVEAGSQHPTAEIYFSPRSGTFTEGSIIQVPIYVNTRGLSVNSMELTILFDPSKLAVVNPSGGKSILGLWIEPPSYDNAKGTVRFVGAIPGGITSDSGLIATITFKARATGTASLKIRSDSQILMNDGLGTTVETSFGRADYIIASKPPEGLPIYSTTHPSDVWYNNRNPVFTWDNTVGADVFAYALDTSPFTVPENDATTSVNSKSFENLADGIWFFHLKARKGGAWGNTTHYTAHIDTSPPAAFEPSVEYVAASSTLRGLVTFKTTDALSGVDHYEVGVIDSDSDSNSSPVFLQTESPFSAPTRTPHAHIVVRAYDAAGNYRDASVDVDTSSILAYLMKNVPVIAVTSLLVAVLALFGLHYLIRHHAIRHVGAAWSYLRDTDAVNHSNERIDLSSIEIPVHEDEAQVPPPPVS